MKKIYFKIAYKGKFLLTIVKSQSMATWIWIDINLAHFLIQRNNIQGYVWPIIMPMIDGLWKKQWINHEWLMQ